MSLVKDTAKSGYIAKIAKKILSNKYYKVCGQIID